MKRRKTLVPGEYDYMMALSAAESHRETDEEETTPSKSPQSEETALNESTSADGNQTTRHGRVRKAKVVFDPSDDHAVKKRIALAAVEDKVEVKPKPKAVEVKKVVQNDKRMSDPLPKPIQHRRKTISTNFELEVGCIVCTRTDTKKGRFVFCTDCQNRGHFTCLRNAKLLGSPIDESNWQCSTCQVCTVCFETSVTERLYKCVSCMNSYHLRCQANQSGVLNRKKFKCENCMENQIKDKLNHTVPAVKSSAVKVAKSSSDGFAGFSQEDTVRSKTGQKSSKTRRLTEADVPSNPPKYENDRVAEVKMRSYTPESLRSNTPPRGPSSTSSSLVSPKAEQPISLDSSFEDDSLPPPTIDPQDEISYDKKTTLTPHESIPDVKRWDCDEVYTYFLGTTTAEYAHIFKENAIDGDALLLIKREDVLNRFNLKLGAALRLYSHIITLQFKNNNPILAWDEI